MTYHRNTWPTYMGEAVTMTLDSDGRPCVETSPAYVLAPLKFIQRAIPGAVTFAPLEPVAAYSGDF